MKVLELHLRRLTRNAMESTTGCFASKRHNASSIRVFEIKMGKIKGNFIGNEHLTVDP